ncbi:hypothetical protein V2J09_006322 [Rumex salicifolius]
MRISCKQCRILGAFIFSEGLITYLRKIQCVRDWLTLKNLKQLRGFLWLAGYYRRFVRSFGVITRPLYQLLKMNGFKWFLDAEAFKTLKQAFCIAPVLALPNIGKEFIVETDACEKELRAVIFAIQKWRHYLFHRHFVIKDDKRSLKYLHEQRLNTPIQYQWLPMLLNMPIQLIRRMIQLSKILLRHSS